jgi:3',5'-cyclic AMP phosphodiesterase CpdA
MRTIVHLSDLHFGRSRAELVEPLLQAIRAAAPDLVVISGDLTQRARVRQFQEARLFLDRIAAPHLIVPGNHDVPLDNPAVRLLSPWRRYRRWIGPRLEPGFRDEELDVVGVNTVNALDWQRGRITPRTVARLCAAFEAQGERTRIVVAHHPFAHEAEEHKALMRGADKALHGLAACGADIVLCGHLHVGRAEPSVVEVGRARAMLLVQAGTGLSTRLRGAANDFNLLGIRPGHVVIERMQVDARSLAFALAGTTTFRRGVNGWRQAAD